MRDLVIFGAGAQAEMADFYFQHDSQHAVKAFVVDGAFRREDNFKGRPVVAAEEVQAEFPPSEFGAFVAIGYSKLNLNRTERLAVMRAKGYAIASYVSSRATVFPGFAAGPNAFILEDNTIQPFVRIGENVTLWSGNHIGHHSVIEDNVFIASHVVVSGHCRIGERTFIGVNATLRDGVTVGPRCIIGMGASILEDCAADGVYPAPKSERAPIPSSKVRSI